VFFVQGLVGSFLRDFGLTVAGSVLLSLFVALTLTPMLAARMPPPSARAHGSFYHRLERGFLSRTTTSGCSAGHCRGRVGLVLRRLRARFARPSSSAHR
jgi:multidrug efflux pump subunit AcrB